MTTTLRQPGESRLTRTQARLLALVLTVAALAALAIFVRLALQTNAAIGQDLMRAPLRTPDGVTTWGKVLAADSGLLATLKCQVNTACAAYYTKAFDARFDLTMQAAPFMFLLFGAVLAWRFQPSRLIVKDPGQGQWAGLEDDAIFEVVKVKPKHRSAIRKMTLDDQRSPRSLYLGHFVPWKPEGFQWKDPQLALLREWKRHENVMVSGAPGSGKTRGQFRQNIVLDAHYGRTALVFDMKWPQTDSGFQDLALYWHRLGRPVYVFAPFSPNSMRLPLLEGITDIDEALKLARAIIAPPEFKEETGKHYKQKERRALAAMILTIAQGPTPTMKELQRLGQMTVAELQTWYARQTNPEIKDALKSMFDERTESLSATLAGIANELSIFYNPHVSRATSAGKNRSEIIDLRKLFREGGLLMVGTPSKDIQEGGEILLQLIKRRIDRDLLDVAANSPGGRLPITATYYLDELPGLGRMPYLMNNLAQLRSKSVCLMLGVQNSEQGGLVYTRDYWKALSTSNVGTRIEFVQGMSKDDAKSLSEEIGETTVDVQTVSRSGHALFGTPWSAEARKSEGLKLERRRLLALEEIQRFPPDLAVVFAKGQNPMLVATPSIDSPHIDVRTPQGQWVKVENKLYSLWKRTMGGVTDIEGETRALIASLSAGQGTGEIEQVQSAPEYWQEWIGMLLVDGALARAQHNDDKFKLKVRVASLSERLSVERDLRYFVTEGWLNYSDNEEELTITQEGLATVGKILKATLRDLPMRGPALYWARQNADRVAGYPNSHVSAESGEAVGYYSQEILTLPVAAAIQLYGMVPDLPRVRHGNQEFVQLPLGDPETIQQALRRAEVREDQEAHEQAVANAGNPERQADKGKPDPAKGSGPGKAAAKKSGKKKPEASVAAAPLWDQQVDPEREAAQDEPPVTIAPEEEEVEPEVETEAETNADQDDLSDTFQGGMM